MKNLIQIVIFIIAVYVLQSCSYSPPIFQADEILLSDYEKAKRLDSVKIVSVNDNRTHKDSIIGYMVYETEHLVINKPLTTYLKNSFNTLIAKDTSIDKFIPVSVRVDEFKSCIDLGMSESKVYHKYSYLFAFPGNSGKAEKVQIIDSMKQGSPFLFDWSMSSLTSEGVREAASMFIWYMNQIKSKTKDSVFRVDAVNGLTLKTETVQTDTINLITKRKGETKSKYGSSIGFYKRDSVHYGLSCGFTLFFKNINSQFETEIETKLRTSEIIQERIFFNTQFALNYYLVPKSNVFFLGAGAGFNFGLESINRHEDKFKFIYGPSLEEFIGFNINDHILIKTGFYQSYFFNSNAVPRDFGFFISTCVTDVY
ncbi:MAG: hypothetical protein WCT77_09685 [Bacteroidota bacterium]